MATATQTETSKKRNARRKTRQEARKKMATKIQDKEFAKTYFEGKSKRAADKKSAFRKKKSRKK